MSIFPRDDILDVLVIGGGIVGAGIARDAAMRGLGVGLVEQADFASGTSSRSSRLLHGGLRYLAQGRVGLVREASLEKRVIHRIAPHLSDPLAFVFPTRRGRPWPKWKLRIGVKLYDLLCGQQNLGRSSTLTARQTMELLPDVNPHDLTGAVRYYDGLTHDARLVLDTLRSAVAHGAMIRSYVRLQGAERQGDIWIASLLDRREEASHEVSARSIVNATGPWSDTLAHSGTRLRLTKGAHLVVDRRRLPIPDAVVMPEGKRILFAIPWGERVILGTTDTDYDGPLERPTASEDDRRYILDVTSATFPGANLKDADVISTWAGLRPLVADSHGEPSDISRRHEIKMNEPGWWDVTGGKLTTYRLIAEQTIDLVAEQLGFSLPPCPTAHEPLLAPNQVRGVSGILPPTVDAQVVKHYCTNEWAVRLDDVMVRRTSWRYYLADHLQVAERVAGWMGEALGWDAAATSEELNRYRSMCQADEPSIP